MNVICYLVSCMGKDYLIKGVYLFNLNYSDWFLFNICLVLLVLFGKINFSVI